MRLLPLMLLLIFFSVPVVEIYLLIKVGGWLGALPTVFLVVFTAVLGVLLLRQQGFAALRRVQAALAHGQIPAMELLEGVLITLGGALLLVPGFFTDGLGFLLLIPPVRRWLVRTLMDRHFLARPWPPRKDRGNGQDGGPPRADGPVTLEGEFKREE
jgi:UPF0716 protein FxsA